MRKNTAKIRSGKGMINLAIKSLRWFVIVLICFWLLYLIVAVVLNGVLSSQDLSLFKAKINNGKIYLIPLRWLVYLIVFLSWSKLIVWKSGMKTVSDAQYNRAMQNRYRLLGWFVIIELLILVS